MVSPELVTIWLSSRKRQQDKYPKTKTVTLVSDPGATTEVQNPRAVTEVLPQLVCKQHRDLSAHDTLQSGIVSFGAIRNSKSKLTCVPWQLSAHSHIALPGFQVVDGADVVQPTTGNVVSGGRVGASHHPGGSQRNGVHLGETELVSAASHRTFHSPRRSFIAVNGLQHIKHTKYIVHHNFRYFHFTTYYNPFHVYTSIHTRVKNTSRTSMQQYLIAKLF